MKAQTSEDLPTWQSAVSLQTGVYPTRSQGRIVIRKNTAHHVPSRYHVLKGGNSPLGFVYADWSRKFVAQIAAKWVALPSGLKAGYAAASPSWSWSSYDDPTPHFLTAFGLFQIVHFMFNALFLDRLIPYDGSAFNVLATVPNGGPFNAAPIFTISSSPANGVWSYNWTNSPAPPWFLTWARLARYTQSAAGLPQIFHYAWASPTPSFGPGALTGAIDFSKFPITMKPGQTWFLGLQIGENGLGSCSSLGWTRAVVT